MSRWGQAGRGFDLRESQTRGIVGWEAANAKSLARGPEKDGNRLLSVALEYWGVGYSSQGDVSGSLFSFVSLSFILAL